MSPRILIIEDEPDLLEAMVSYLNLDGFSATGESTLKAASEWIDNHSFDILILDLGLPDGDGLHWLNQRNDLEGHGVIITTARGESVQRISGAKAGADMYLVKPVQLEELSCLTHNLYRRLHPDVKLYWKLNLLNWSLESPDGSSIKLTNSELKILQILAQVPGKVVARQDVIQGLGYTLDAYDPKRLEIMIRRLRLKAQELYNYPLPLETIHGAGLAFTAAIQIV